MRILGDRKKRQFSLSSSSAITLSKDLVLLLQRYLGTQEMFACREMEDVISQEKIIRVYVDRAGGRNSSWGNLEAESGLHSYTALILLYLQDTDTCWWGSTKAWQSSLLSSLFSQTWLCLDLHYTSLLFSELYQNFQHYWRNVVKTMAILSNFSHVRRSITNPCTSIVLAFPHSQWSITHDLVIHALFPALLSQSHILLCGLSNIVP